MYQIFKKSAYLPSALPIFSLQDQKVIFKDGRIGVGFLVQGAAAESWSQFDYTQTNQLLARQLQMLPTGTVVQKTDIYYDQEFIPPLKSSGYYEGKLYSHFFARLALLEESYLFLSFPAHGYENHRANPVVNLFAWGETLVKNPFENVTLQLAKVDAMAEEFINGLHGLKQVSFTRLDTQQLNTLMVRFVNLSFEQQHQAKKLNREIYNDLSALVVGEKKANIITMTGQGSDVFASIKNADGVTHHFCDPIGQRLQFPHIVTQSLLIKDTQATLKSLDLERKINNSLDWLTNQDHKLQAEETEEFTAYVRSGNKALVGLHVSVIVFESDERLLKSYLERTVAGFRQMYGAETIIESYDTANLFFASLPGNAFQHYRWLIASDEIATCYLNFMAPCTGQTSGDYLCDRYRNLLQVNLFNTALSNQNAIVIGPSGSGKSYTMGNLITQRLERGARQIIIDKGGTYRHVLQALNGHLFQQTYFEYHPDRPLTFNPFIVDKKADGSFQLSSEKSNFLIALLSVLWKGGQDGSVTPAERAIFKMLLPQYYKYLHQQSLPAGMNSFYNFLKNYQSYQKEEIISSRHFDLDQFLTVLQPFVFGEYRQMLNASFDMELGQHPLICFDLDTINTDPVLYPIVTLLITELALDQIKKYPNEVKYLYLDEAWSMLSGSMQEFINELFRTIRKNNGSVSIITQGLDEIVQSSIGEAILVNADTKIILKHQDSRLIEQLSIHLGFTEHETDLIRSIRVEKDFRELFIKQGEQARVYVLETSPHLDAVLTSKPAERNYLRKLINHYQGNIPYAVNQYVETKTSSGKMQQNT